VNEIETLYERQLEEKVQKFKELELSRDSISVQLSSSNAASVDLERLMSGLVHSSSLIFEPGKLSQSFDEIDRVQDANRKKDKEIESLKEYVEAEKHKCEDLGAQLEVQATKYG
jgi:hypothetical protein